MLPPRNRRVRTFKRWPILPANLVSIHNAVHPDIRFVADRPIISIAEVGMLIAGQAVTGVTINSPVQIIIHFAGNFLQGAIDQADLNRIMRSVDGAPLAGHDIAIDLNP